jgi:two-component system nitrogen regulation response regulator GlnG
MWPGNVRELQSVIKQAMLNASGHLLLPEFLPGDLRSTLSPASLHEPKTSGLDLDAVIESLLQHGEQNLHAKVIEVVERVLLGKVLRHTHGHQAQASDLLGLNRTTLRHKLRDLGMVVDKVLIEDAQTEKGDGKG